MEIFNREYTLIYANIEDGFDIAFIICLTANNLHFTSWLTKERKLVFIRGLKNLSAII